MKKIINPRTTLLAVGVLQPVRVVELKGFIERTFEDAGDFPTESELRKFLQRQVQNGRVLQFKWGNRTLYALTNHGNLYLSPESRKLRDKFRAYLLRDAHRRRIVESRTGKNMGLVGVSPTSDASTAYKRSASNKLVGSRSVPRANQQVYWTRFSRQFRSETGPASSVRDTLPPLISLATKEQVGAARGLNGRSPLDSVGLGMCIGLSPALITQMAYRPTRYYREFELAKKGGGTRKIRSPRIFIKVVQWFLADFILNSMKMSNSVHSFRSGRSIVTNAVAHEQRRYVANIDIQDFFGSVTTQSIFNLLKGEGFSLSEADIISRLVTYENCLPQGAPTSPALSNALLFHFDEEMSEFTSSRGVSYSRYADDMTFSGDQRSEIGRCIENARKELRKHNLNLNESKTRIASAAGQQRVTGVVVNDRAVPPRILRRKIRAIFHQAENNPGAFSERIGELGGYLGYLREFPKLRRAASTLEYMSVLSEVQVLDRRRRRREQKEAR